MDEAIVHHAPQETLYDQPFVDRRKVRVTGPFTVEAVPAPAVKSLDELLPSPLGRGAGGEGVKGESKKPVPQDLLEFARQLRKEQTDAERLMWSLLRDRRLAGFKFRRQHPIEPYVLDFYCHEARLAVELDGGQHNAPDARAHDEQRTSFLESQGIRMLRFWNSDVLNNIDGLLQAIYDALTPTLSQREREFTADASIARSGETLGQAEWRDELLRAGIRGKNGQYIRFARLEPLPGCRWLHADGETQPSDEGANSVREPAPAYNPMRVVVSFGPEHVPLEQRQVEQAIEEAQTLVPRPKLIVFAAFQFDPEAAKDIDETKWPGVTLLKAQMNAELLTDDLKKKRASNESFWLIGQPDVQVERIAPSPLLPLPVGEGARVRASCTASRSTVSTTTTRKPARSNRAARTRSRSGCWTATMTGAASTRGRCSSRWQARTKAGQNLRATSRPRSTRNASKPTGAPCHCPLNWASISASRSKSWMTGGSRA